VVVFLYRKLTLVRYSYAVLQSCWHATPEQRPTFAGLSTQLQLAGRQSHAPAAAVASPAPVQSLAEPDTRTNDLEAGSDSVELQTFVARGPRLIAGYAAFDDIAI
jgi:hypothetical protein